MLTERSMPGSAASCHRRERQQEPGAKNGDKTAGLGSEHRGCHTGPATTTKAQFPYDLNHGQHYCTRRKPAASEDRGQASKLTVSVLMSKRLALRFRLFRLFWRMKYFCA